jgi:hypothetical protein
VTHHDKRVDSKNGKVGVRLRIVDEVQVHELLQLNIRCIVLCCPNEKRVRQWLETQWAKWATQDSFGNAGEEGVAEEEKEEGWREGGGPVCMQLTMSVKYMVTSFPTVMLAITLDIQLQSV